MPEEFRPGFIYIKSDELNQEVAFSLQSGWVYCEDKGPDGKLMNYSPEEIEILKASEGIITLGIHRVKKIFGGRIVKYDGSKSDNAGKQDKGKEPDSTANNTNTGGKVPKTNGNSPNIGTGELELY